MAIAPPRHVVHRAGEIEWEPMFINGEQIGETYALVGEGSHGNEHDASLWRTDAPASYEYLFTGDESFYVLEGSVSIELVDTNERIDLRAGDIAFFAKGRRSIWTFTEPFKKFTVISD